jgi:hypothetical protein
MHLVAGYERDASKWTSMRWTDIHSRRSYFISTEARPEEFGLTVPVQTLRGLFRDWKTNPESKSLAPDGEPCGRRTRGLLRRRPVRTRRELVRHVGKETNLLEEALAGLVSDVSELNIEYPDPERDPWQRLVLPTISRLGPVQVARLAQVDRRTVERIVAGSTPKPETRERILDVIRRMLREKLGADGSVEHLAAQYLEGAPDQRCWACGRSLAERRRNTRYCNHVCRMRRRRLKKAPLQIS